LGGETAQANAEVAAAAYDHVVAVQEGTVQHA
jgi:hypothetical protein